MVVHEDFCGITAESDISSSSEMTFTDEPCRESKISNIIVVIFVSFFGQPSSLI